MKKQILIFLGIALILIAGCSRTNSLAKEATDTNLPLTAQSRQVKSQKTTSDNTNLFNERLLKEEIKVVIDKEIGVRMQEVEHKYLEDKLALKEDVLSLGNEYREELRNFQYFIFGVAGFIGIILTIFSFFGFRKYFAIDRQLTETKNLFDIMAKDMYEKEQELHAKFDEIIGREKGKNTSLNAANFLDYEHKLYFAQAYLPITRKIQDYKKSLFILGEYWLEQGKCGRALLRFKEIERIQNELDSKKNYLFRILISLGRKKIFQERILGDKTAKYFNLYGYTCDSCGEEENDARNKEELFKKAIDYYKKAITADENYASPYYNLGRLYGVNLGDNKMALEWYKKALNKNPDLTRETYRNMTCSLIKLGEPTEALINTLDNIPNNDPYWQAIIDDAIINPKIKATRELRSFILKKFPSAQNIT